MLGLVSSSLCPMDQLGLARVRKGMLKGGYGQMPARAEHDWVLGMGWESGQEPEAKTGADRNQGRMGTKAGKTQN